MRRLPPGFDIHRALALIGLTLRGVDQQLVDEVPNGSSNTWPRRQELFREIIKKAHHETMRKTHPDLCQDDTEREQALERAKLVNEAVDCLMLIRPEPPRPRPVPMVIYNANSTSANSTYFYPSVTVRFY